MESQILQSPPQSQAVEQSLVPEWDHQSMASIPPIPVESIQSPSGLKIKNSQLIPPHASPVYMLPTPISEELLLPWQVKGAAKRKIHLPKKRPHLSSSSSGPDSSDSSISGLGAEVTPKIQEKQYVCFVLLATYDHVQC